MAVGAPTVRNLYTGTTTGNLYVDRRQFYLTPAQFSELFANVSPFLTFSMNANFRTGLQDPVFKLFEHKAPWERQYMTTSTAATIAAHSSGTSTESGAFTFSAAYGVPYSSTSTPDISEALANTIWEVWDSTGTTLRGVAMLTEDSSSSTAKFKNLGATAITTVSGDLFVLISNGQGEGAVAPEAWSSELTTVWNQCQIFRTPIEITGTLAQASLRGANKELARLRSDKMMEHKIHMEKAFLFGASPLGTNLAAGDTFSNLDKLTGLDDKVARTTTGLVRAIQLYGASTGQYRSNITLEAGSVSYDDLVDEMEIIFQYVPTSGVKTAFTGAKALSFWSKRAMEKNSGWTINHDTSEVNFAGQKVRTLVTPHGDLDLNLTHSFKYEHANQMLIVDPRNIEYVQYRPSAFNTNIKTDDGYDGIKDEYFSDAGLGITNIKAHQLITITG